MLYFPLEVAFEMWNKAKNLHQGGKLAGIQAIRFKHDTGKDILNFMQASFYIRNARTGSISENKVV